MSAVRFRPSPQPGFARNRVFYFEDGDEGADKARKCGDFQLKIVFSPSTYKQYPPQLMAAANSNSAAFKRQSLADWQQTATKELKGAPIEKLQHRTLDGLDIAPYHTAAELKVGTDQHLPGDFPYRRGLRIQNNQWSMAARIRFSDAKTGNRMALHALNHGADALIFEGPIADDAAFEQLTADILPQYIYLLFNGMDAIFLGKRLLHWADRLQMSPFAFKASLLHSPEQLLLPSAQLEAIAHFYRSQLPAVAPFGISTAGYRAEGAGIVEETALALAAGHELLHQLVGAGLSVDEAAPLLQFALALDTDYFGEMARIRAFRQAWAQLVQQYAPRHSCTTATTIHAAAAAQVSFSLDRHTNLLRYTTLGMSAVIAGVQSLCLPPFDASIHGGDDFSQELSLQIQLLLQHEAQLGQVADPAAGSYFLEQLTDQIGDKAWRLFQSIEVAGGWLLWRDSGALTQLLQRGQEARAAALASRKQIRVGLNQYPNSSETFDDWTETSARHPLEVLRLKLARQAHPPRIFMLPIGDVAMRMARLNFSLNFLGCAGFELVSNNGCPDIDTAIAAARAAACDAIVLCSDDASWATAVPALAKAFGRQQHLILAGAPGAAEADFRAAGFQTFIHLRANLLQTLEELSAQLHRS